MNGLHLLVPYLGREPLRQTDGAAGFDLEAYEDVTIGAGQTVLVQTWHRMAIPDGFAGLVLPRSGLALKHGLTVLNAPGLIDSDFRGQIGVILHNTSEKRYRVCCGDRIAQLLIVAFAPVSFVHSDVENFGLLGTARGDKGFGSTDTPEAA
jgi:dUTP pyrophosphatase